MRWRDRVRGRGALIAFAALELIALPVILVCGRGSWFTADDWDFFSARTAGNAGDLFRSHFQHWTTIPILVYRLLWSLVGMHSYVPYQTLVILGHLTVVALLRVIMRRAGVRPWVATIVASVLVFFGAGAENILVAFQISFIGSLVFGLTQLLLADHDGPIDRRDWLGLLAGLAGLMCSGAAIAMTVMVGLAVIVRRGRRGWPIALFHTAPLAVAYFLWSRFSPEGQSADVYHSQSITQVAKFVANGIKAAFGGLERTPALGAVLGILLIAGLGLAYGMYGRRELRRSAAPLIALLAGAVVFLVLTGLVRAGQPPVLVRARGTGPARARESRYIYMTAALFLPAIALALDTIIRRWRRLAIPVLALPLIGLPANFRQLQNYSPFYVTLPYERQSILSLPRSPLADEFTHSPLPAPFSRLIPEGLTLGWIVDSRSSLPPPAFLDEREIRSQVLRFLLVRTIPTSVPRCEPLARPVHLVLTKGESITFERGNALVAYQPLGTKPSRADLLTPSTYTAVVGSVRLRIAPEPKKPGVQLCQ
ncbi:MAG: hypothetical protein QOG50_1475 [Actinomycetota bacterium]|jgi:hypothetical protein|nr:hypothetical protein [Actinomycetota bacterium]